MLYALSIGTDRPMAFKATLLGSGCQVFPTILLYVKVGHRTL